jgi:hypothetical protein
MSSFTSSIGAWVEAASAENSKESAFESSIGLSDDSATVCSAVSGAFAAGVASIGVRYAGAGVESADAASTFGLASTLGPVSAS